MGGELAKGLFDRGQHGWQLPNPYRGDLLKMGSGMTVDFRLALEIRGSRIIPQTLYPLARKSSVQFVWSVLFIAQIAG